MKKASHLTPPTPVNFEPSFIWSRATNRCEYCHVPDIYERQRTACEDNYRW